jgi:UDP-N-acetylmuramoyl-L-alanyl-D-glutamate--2,6-diaminopimelate ligase
VAIRGTISDGHDFIEKQSCSVAAVMHATHFQKIIAKGVTYVQVRDTNSALHLWLPIMVIHHKT